MKTRRLICNAIREIAVEEGELGPVPDRGILVQTQYSAVSVGTELWNWMHGANPGGEARFPRGTGYCSTGIVIEVGKDVTSVKHITFFDPNCDVPVGMCRSAVKDLNFLVVKMESYLVLKRNDR